MKVTPDKFGVPLSSQMVDQSNSSMRDTHYILSEMKRRQSSDSFDHGDPGWNVMGPSL